MEIKNKPLPVNKAAQAKNPPLPKKVTTTPPPKKRG